MQCLKGNRKCHLIQCYLTFLTVALTCIIYIPGMTQYVIKLKKKKKKGKDFVKII